MRAETATVRTEPRAVLKTERPRPGELRLTLADPPANTLSEAMLGALAAALEAAGRDEAVRAVVIAAEGRIFSGGHDLKELTARRGDADGGRAYFEEMFARCSAVMQAIVR